MDIIKWFNALDESEKRNLIETINEYQSIPKLTDLKDWANLNKEIISNKLYNCICNNYISFRFRFFYENITYKEFMIMRFSGKKTWEEFTKLRGY